MDIAKLFWVFLDCEAEENIMLSPQKVAHVKVIL